MFLLLLLVLHILGTDACMRNKDPGNEKKPMVDLTCPDDIDATAAKRSITVTVSWDRNDFKIHSTHPVKGIYQTVPIYGASSTVNRAFQEGLHYVQYKAVDESGTFDSCSFNVKVTVIRCAALYNPQFGILSCDAGNLYGSRCTVSCLPGYSVVGVRDIVCGQDRLWSNDAPFCRTTTCPDPGTPLHGTRYCTTATHAFGSICSFACSHGYQLQGNPRLICKSNNHRTYWSEQTPICKEITPPQVEVCPTAIERTSSGALTEIQKPKILFRTASGERAPFSCTYFGTAEAHNFTQGSHTITCKAFDPAYGDQAVATCQFTIKIKNNPCQPLSQPKNGMLLCSRAQGGARSMHDVTCRLFCRRGHSMARHDVALSGGVFECDHSGRWQPSQYVPSCIKPKRPQEIRLPSEIFFHSSNCSTPAHLNHVRVQFQSEVQRLVRLQDSCAMNPGDCIVEDVITNCDTREASTFKRYARFENARSSDRHTSSSVVHHPRQLNFILPIQFHFGTRIPEKNGVWPDEYHRASHRLFSMFDNFEQQILAGAFRLGNTVQYLNITEIKDSLTYARPRPICDIGHQFNEEILYCVSCGAGTFYKLTTDSCQLCQAGTYQNDEAQFKCKECPEGTKTVIEGATSLSQCVDINECESNPCLNNGHCRDGLTSYTCICATGFSGTHCEDTVYDCSVSACQNGATCQPVDQENYTCKCRPNYSGEYCQFYTVDGGWSDWSAWSVCSKSCRGGISWRNRTCTSPIPSHGGKACAGSTVQERVCNVQTCPSCKRLRRPYGGSIHCTQNEELDIVACKVRCPEGFAFSGPVYPVYICGRNTSYLWPHQSPDNPRCVIPACAKITEAEEASYHFRSNLRMTCQTETRRSHLQRQIRRRAVELTSDLECVRDGSCRLSEPQIEGCRPRTKRSSVASSVTIQVSIIYHMNVNIPDKTALMRYNQTSWELEKLGSWLINRGEHDDLYIMVDGEKVYVEANTSAADVSLHCPPGFVQNSDSRFCVACGAGSFYNSLSNSCILCDLGFYQPEPAQLHCHACPYLQTTFGRGAVFKLECYKNGTNPPVIPEDYVEHKDLNKGTLVAVVCVLTLLVIVTVITVRRRNRVYLVSYLVGDFVRDDR